METPASPATMPHVLPQHLGEKWRGELLKRRALTRIRHKMGYVGMDGETTFAEKPRRLGRRRGRLQRFWLRSANLSEHDAANIAPLLTAENTGVSVPRNLAATFAYTFVGWVFASLMLAIWSSSADASSSTAGFLWGFLSVGAPILWLMWATNTTLQLPRKALQNINTDAVTETEIEAFLPTVRGDLDRMYLNTVLQTIRQPLPVSAGHSVGAALRSVGDAVSALPGDAIPVGADDPASLRLSALDKKQRAAHEADSLVQASLVRQAEADEKQAEIVENGGTAAKRARARHDEVAAQLQTLRTVLTTYASGANTAGLEQNELFADATAQAAAGAMASAQAKRELDDAELAALYGQPLPEPQVQAVGVGAATAPQTPSGKWWQ